ncbi:MAG: addiction module protein [Candidatus Binatota bacterium]
MESPAWHKDILDERRQRIAEGKARFVDWEKAKAEIRYLCAIDHGGPR